MAKYDPYEIFDIADAFHKAHPIDDVEVEKAPSKPSKGQHHGECNRFACNLQDARWYNPHANAYYCNRCATLLDEQLKFANLAGMRYV